MNLTNLSDGDSNLVISDSNVSLNRLYLLLFFLILCFLTIAFRLLDLTFTNIEEVPKIIADDSNVNTYSSRRYNILDRNGVIIATNIPTASLYAHPKRMISRQDAAKSIASILNFGDYHKLLSRLESGKNFIWIKRHVMPEEQQKIHDLGIPGIYFINDERRVYPHGNLFSHILGYVDIDGNGVSGVEYSQNEWLNFHDLELTIDLRIQHIVRENLKKTIALNQALGGAVVVMDAENGEILSLVSYPDFNPHDVSHVRADQLFNQATLSVEERGSVFKAFTFAIAFDLDKIKINDAFNVATPLKLGRFLIHDYRGKGGYLSVPEILMYSSNIGVGQIAQRIGKHYQKMYMKKAEILNTPNIGLTEIGRPLYPNDSHWDNTSLVTIAYGHGIAVTPIHTAQMFSIIVNGGLLYEPTILKNHKKSIGKRIFKESTSYTMRKLLRLVCTKGYGKKAEVDGYLVMGKTGTAEKIAYKGGGYSKSRNVALFVGAFPANAPKYVVLAIVDEPKPNRYNNGFPTGGMVAAPLVGDIIKSIGSIMVVKYQNPEDPKVKEALHANYHPRCKETN